MTPRALQIDQLPAAGRSSTPRRRVQGLDDRVRFVSVSGHQARVEARYKFADAGAEPRTVLLLSEDGEWRVSDPG